MSASPSTPQYSVPDPVGAGAAADPNPRVAAANVSAARGLFTAPRPSTAPGAASPQPPARTGKRKGATTADGVAPKKGKVSAERAGAGRPGLTKAVAARRAQLPPTAPPQFHAPMPTLPPPQASSTSAAREVVEEMPPRYEMPQKSCFSM
jgi:hypothetical protein